MFFYLSYFHFQALSAGQTQSYAQEEFHISFYSSVFSLPLGPFRGDPCALPPAAQPGPGPGLMSAGGISYFSLFHISHFWPEVENTK